MFRELTFTRSRTFILYMTGKDRYNRIFSSFRLRGLINSNTGYLI